MLSIRVNDDPETEEKIFLQVIENINSLSFVPFSKGSDETGSYIFSKFFCIESSEYPDKAKPIKVGINISNYVRDKVIPITEESFFFMSSSEDQMEKYSFLHNLNMPYTCRRLLTANFKMGVYSSFTKLRNLVHSADLLHSYKVTLKFRR